MRLRRVKEYVADIGSAIGDIGGRSVYRIAI
jgi:hypothetical protein